MNITLPLSRVLSRLFLVYFACFFSIATVYAQKNPTGPVTPGGYMDTVKDRLGNAYALKDLYIDDGLRNGPPGASSRPQPNVMMACNTGYFQVFMEVGSGMEGNTAQEIDRRAVLCQVLNDISNFINSPLTSSGQKVNIWVRNINNLQGVPPNALGLATSFYNVPSNPTVSGIADNTTWLTIKTGVDAYTNVAPPIYSSGGNSFFHGLMGFNFNTVSWNTTLTSATVPNGTFDLYTVMLHEVLHALGFASSISTTGASNLGANFPYYSRYDRFLQTSGGTNLITNSGACNVMYGYTFTGPVSALTPAGTYNQGHTTNCTDAIKYAGGVTQKTYSPCTWEGGSSLSHFEDECQVPSGFLPTPPASDNLYFVMSNATDFGMMKRYPQPEERQVLCDIGYEVNTTYGVSSNVNYNYYNYGGSACPGLGVVGVNDGINNGMFTFISNGGAAVGLSGFVTNDPGATGFECLQDITPNSTAGAIIPNSGVASTTVNYTPPSGASGVRLLRYVPTNGGQRGNITYIYVFVSNGNCTPTACDFVNNGSFENAQTCGMLTLPGILDCWEWCANTPDLFVRNCTNMQNLGIADGTVPTTMSTPASESHPPTIGNDVFAGFWSERYTTGMYGAEAIQTHLNSPLVPSTNYIVSFWARVANHSYWNNVPTTVVLGTSTAPLSVNTWMIPWGAFPNLTNLHTQSVPADNQWHHYSVSVPFTGTVPHDNLVILNSVFENYNVGLGFYRTYVYVDDVSIRPTGTFTLPATITTCDPPLADLSTYVSDPGGVFAGPGVQLSGGIYSFDPLVAGIGLHTLTYTYTDVNGCVQILYSQIEVVNGSPLTATASPNPIYCPGQTVTLSVTGGSANYTWNPSVGCLNPPCSTATVTPSATTIYAVSSGTPCSTTVTVDMIPLSAWIQVLAPTNVACSNIQLQAHTNNNSLPFTYQWYLNGVAIPGANTFIFNATATGNYTVEITLGSCSATSAPAAVTIVAPPVVTINIGTVGCQQTLTANVIPASSSCYSYQWIGPLGYIGNSVSIVATQGPGTYTVNVWNSCYSNCMVSQTVVVTGSSSTIPVTASSPCLPAILSVTPVTGFTYTWTGTTTGTGPNLNITTGGTWTVTGYDPVTNCMVTGTITFVPAPPIAVTAVPTNICVGQTVNLTASGGTSYSWSPSVTCTLPCNTATATPASNTTYTATDVAGCQAQVTVTVTTPVTPTITPVGPLTFCQGGSVVLNANTGTGYSYQWYQNSLPVGTNSSSYTATTSGSYTVQITNGPCTSTSGAVVVTVNPIPVVTVTPPVSTIVNCQSQTLTASGAISYTWLPATSLSCATCAVTNASPTTTTTYTVTGTANGCSATATATVNVIQPNCSPCSKFNGQTFTVITGGNISGLTSGANYYVTGNVTVNASAGWTNVKMLLGTNVKITVAPAVNLTMRDCHLFGCTDMWDGIELSSSGALSGRLQLSSNNLIEDAKTAVKIINAQTPAGSGYVLMSDGTIFNRNTTAVYIENYTVPTYQTIINEYPFRIQNTVFTCRKFDYSGSGYPFSWPTVATLKGMTTYSNPFQQPYYISNFAPLSIALCKNAQPAQRGIWLKKVGNTSGLGTSAVYKEITIGRSANTTTNYQNLFDNHECGIYGENVNITSYNGAFINIRRLGAIYLNSDYSFNNRANIIPGSTTGHIFYDCQTGVNIYNYYDVLAHTTKMYSIHSTANSLIGQSGYRVQAWNFFKVNLNNNELYNINVGISFYASAIPGTANYNGGDVKIINNKIMAHPSGSSAISTQFITQAITAATTSTCLNCSPTSGMYINVDNNQINDVYNGIYVSGFKRQVPTSNYNIMTVRLNTTLTSQAGIQHTSCASNVIRNNSVTGSIANAYTHSAFAVKGITSTTCPAQTVLCNTVNNVGKAFEFLGASNNSRWMENTMINSGRGYVINGSGAVVGPQGNTALSYDNKWNVSGSFNWLNPPWCQTLAQASAVPANSKFYFVLPTSTPAFPVNHCGTLPYVFGTSVLTASTASSYNCASTTLPMFSQIAQYEQVALNQMLYTCMEDENRFLSQLATYEALRLDTTLTDTSTILSDFADSAALSRFKYLNDMADDLASGNLSALAYSVNNPMPAHSSMSASGIVVRDNASADYIVDNYRQYYDLYLRYLADTLDTDDSIALDFLASLCPLKHGMIIYQARALYNVIFDDVRIFYDEDCGCEDPQSKTRTSVIGISEEERHGSQSYVAAPNPGIGYINLHQQVVSNELVKISVTTMSGREVYNGSTQFAGGKSLVTVNGMVPGMYLIHLKDSKGISYIIKYTVL